MANYNREILVPYLRDVCSVEMLCQRLMRDTRRCEGNIESYRKKFNRKLSPETKPGRGHLLYVFSCIAACVACAIFILVVLTGMWPQKPSIRYGMFYPKSYTRKLSWAIFGCVIAAGIFLLSLVVISFITDEHKKKLEKYQQNLKENAVIRQEYTWYKDHLHQAECDVAVLKKKLRDAQVLRQQVYSVNIIPARYRSVYVAYYLYDYFNTSRETDLDKVIQTLLLDEIKQRLDKIISQMEELLIEQRYQTALQEKQSAMIASNHREQMKRMARMEQNQELQADYLNMIEQNQNVTNFILTMDFLYK